ncbi:hypothetical protein SEA_WEISS13_59 [Mycobacterium phage Weiss13]|nr:hypothetical protein SEA_WEISS13_59 [Mycobacterium phage Weiss13]
MAYQERGWTELHRETEFVLARELSDGSLPHMPPADELPHRGRITRILNDSGVLTIECEDGMLSRGMNAPVERYKREA